MTAAPAVLDTYRWLRRNVLWTNWRGRGLSRRPLKPPIPRVPAAEHESRADTSLGAQPLRAWQVTSQERVDLYGFPQVAPGTRRVDMPICSQAHGPWSDVHSGIE
jgi:hypothetical protein